MVVDFQKLTEDVSSIKDMLLTLNARLDKQQSAAPLTDEVFTVGQAADFLNLTVQTVYSLVWQRKIPFSKVSKRLYFSRQELTEWLKKHRTATVDEQAQQYNQSRSSRGNRRGKGHVA